MRLISDDFCYHNAFALCSHLSRAQLWCEDLVQIRNLFDSAHCDFRCCSTMLIWFACFCCCCCFCYLLLPRFSLFQFLFILAYLLLFQFLLPWLQGQPVSVTRCFCFCYLLLAICSNRSISTRALSRTTVWQCFRPGLPSSWGVFRWSFVSSVLLRLLGHQKGPRLLSRQGVCLC
jgi:hypothetical protein